MPTQVQAALGQRTRACVPHTPYTSVLKFVPPAGRVCGAATHAAGGDAGYGLLRLIVSTGYLKMPYNEKAACTLEVSKCRLLFWDVGWSFMPTRFQAALGHRTRGQRVPTLRLLF